MRKKVTATAEETSTTSTNALDEIVSKFSNLSPEHSIKQADEAIAYLVNRYISEYKTPTGVPFPSYRTMRDWVDVETNLQLYPPELNIITNAVSEALLKRLVFKARIHTALSFLAQFFILTAFMLVSYMLACLLSYRK